LSRELLYNAILPPLIFDAAFELRWQPLRRNLALIGVLATAVVCCCRHSWQRQS
jgi:Na+:H+ antiporter